jgi:very-short-patch-repair endonuclease
MLPLSEPFTASMAAEVGVSRNQLMAMTREGLVRRVFRGVYVDASAEDSLEVRAGALQLVAPPTAVATEELSAWVAGVDLLARGTHIIPPPLTFSQPLERTRVRQPGVEGTRRMLAPQDVEILNGIRRTTSLRTAIDLARKRPRPRALAALDALLRTGDFTYDELLDETARFKGFRGVVQLRAMTPLADARAESPAESAMRLIWIETELPKVTPQIPVCNTFGAEIYRLDMGLPEIKYAAEYDGVEWHSSPEQRERDRKRREWLRRQGWVIDVLGKAEVFDEPRRARAVFRAGIQQATARSRTTSGVTNAPTRRPFA